MKIGIHKIAFYIPSCYIELKELAQARNVDADKYLIGLGQQQTAIVERSQDIITLGANAASQILTKEDIENIDLVLFATESSVDESKAAGLYLHRLLNLRSDCRVVELKQACYSSAIAINFAKNHVKNTPNSKVLIIASDIAKYGAKSAGEPTQGAGAVAILISENPNILAIEEQTTFISEDVADFYRPTNCSFPIVDGKLSTTTYLRFFEIVYQQYLLKTGFTNNQFSAICCHMPYAKLGQKALLSQDVPQTILERYEYSKYYNKFIGNIYTGSLFLSLISLLESDESLQPNNRIGFFAYGSGATGEFFTGVLQPNYKQNLNQEIHQNLMKNRTKLTIDEYEALYTDQEIILNTKKHRFELEKIENNVRYYQKQH